MQTNGDGDLLTAIHYVYGAEVARGMLALAHADETLKIEGFISKPSAARGSRSCESFFLGNRYIQSGLLRRALEDAYQTLLPTGRFPVCALRLSLARGLVDENAHPAKTEVRFADERHIFRFVTDAVRKVLTENNIVPEITYGEIPYDRPASFAPLAFAEGYAGEAYAAAPFEALPLEARTGDYAIVGQVFSTYWLVARGEDLYIIDQHAAHERIIYEEMLNAAEGGGAVPAQATLETLVLTLGPRDMETLRENMEVFERFGYEFEAMGHDRVAVRACPFALKGQAGPAFFEELLAAVESGERATGSIRARIASASCKAAVKAREALSGEEARALVHRLMELEKPFTCPHGRPTVVRLAKREIERMFMRV
jgi:DNA mismatch repair protein MutL